MAVLVDLIFLSITGFFQWYSSEALGGDLLVFFIKQLFMYILLQMILQIIPFLKRIVNALWFPFRFLHVYMHVNAAKELARDLDKKKEEDDENYDHRLDSYLLRSSFATGLSRNDENAMLIASFNRIGYARQVALAPSRFGWIMLLGYLVVSPLALWGSLFTTVVGAIIHFYFFVGIFGVMMPTLNDWLFIINTVILNLNIRPIYLFNAVLIHVLFTFESFWRTKDFFIAILIGTVMFVIYLWGLIMVTLIALQGNIKHPKIFFIPFKSPKELRASVTDIEFFEMDEFDDLVD
ncbi:MAG: hypothetical protein ACXADY_15945 [Candidatus Hodarchaeales archaeon]|jgi:hypothetical protein